MSNPAQVCPVLEKLNSVFLTQSVDCFLSDLWSFSISRSVAISHSRVQHLTMARSSASSTIPQQAGPKRQRHTPVDDEATSQEDQTGPIESADADTGTTKPGQSSSFRNVSACNRCRLRKNRCDQKLPSCASCAKANVACVGFDPITKQEIPRSYVFYLETRVMALEKILTANNISYPPAKNLEICSRPAAGGASAQTSATAIAKGVVPATTTTATGSALATATAVHNSAPMDALKPDTDERSPAMVNLVGSSKPRSLASTSGVSFTRVVVAAMQYSVSDSQTTNDRQQGVTTMRDSFFGLHTKPTIKPAPFPTRDVGLKLVDLYFQHANPQIPILHRGEFMRTLERAYENGLETLNPRQQYMINMVFAIGSGVIVGEPIKRDSAGNAAVKVKDHADPEQYHASATVHFEACLAQSGGYLEVLQAILLLANFALLRPVPPGLWYITGVAVRLAVDLGLHYEDGGGEPWEPLPGEPSAGADQPGSSAQERGRRFWIRDMRRRLWWCTYSFDRLVSVCVGRPFGVSDQVITTELPSLADDKYITLAGPTELPSDGAIPSYKHVAHHYFRLRMLQSEILQVLQYNQAQMTHRQGAQTYPEMHTHLPSPFLARFDSFRSWRSDMDNRLRHWKTSAPTAKTTGVAFSTEFLDLNYYQAIIMLYKQSLSVPTVFQGEYNPSNEVNSPSTYTAEPPEDAERIYMKIAQAGNMIVHIYRELHMSGLVSYTYLSTHHLFMAGISYLYAIWHSPFVRSHYKLRDVDFTILAAKSIFDDMKDKCPPAETCRDTFDRTAKATIKMASANGGFGQPNKPPRARRRTTTAVSASAPDVSALHNPHKLEHQQSFPFDLSMNDNLSSPGRSAAGDMSSQGTPPLGTVRGTDGDTFKLEPRSLTGLSPGASSLNQDGSVMDLSHTSSPSLTRQATGSQAGTAPSYITSQYSLQGPMEMDYSDSTTMDFLHNIGSEQNGDFTGGDQVDFNLDFNWGVLHNDFDDAAGQNMNPFGTFFFGGPGGTGGAGGGA